MVQGWGVLSAWPGSSPVPLAPPPPPVRMHLTLKDIWEGQKGEARYTQFAAGLLDD